MPQNEFADERIAVFDSDGTLWCEQPASALAFFTLARLQEVAAEYVPPVDPWLVQAAQSPHPAALRQGLARYHRSRAAAAPQLLAALHV